MIKQKLVPHLVAFVTFLLISVIYFSPVLDGKRLSQHDRTTYLGMSKEIRDYRSTTGEEALWTNTMFGGMPSFLSGTKFDGNLIKHVDNTLKTAPVPISYLLINFVGFYLLLLVLGVNPWVSLVGSLAAGFSSYFFIVLGAGHNSKVLAIAYIAPVLAGILMAFRGKRLLGGALLAITLSLELVAGHPQITYYAFIMVLLYGVVEFYFSYKENKLPELFKTLAVLVVAAVLAVGSNASRLYTTYEYGKYSTRGESDLITEGENQTSGLDKNYILDYSYSIGEAFTAFIPRFKGGGMSEKLNQGSALYTEVARTYGPEQAKGIVKRVPLYWGSQPIVSGPFYFGAVLCFLFIFGLFIVEGRMKWWLALVVFVSFLLSLGKNFSFLTDLLIDYLPMYNKFRDVKNIVIIQNLAMALLGVLAVNALAKKEVTKSKALKSLKYSVYIAGGFALLFVVLPGIAGNFQGQSDQAFGWPNALLSALEEDRKSALRTDSVRTLMFVLLSATTLFYLIKEKLSSKVALSVWAVLVLVDMVSVNRNYINNDNFVSEKLANEPFKKTEANRQILQDTDPDFRVLNLTVSPFNDASTAYFHKSIGGYHGAKMKRYQELIERQITPEISKLSGGLQNMTSLEEASGVFKNTPILNMLNAKYVIISDQNILSNTSARGAAWVVQKAQIVENANEEIAQIGKVDLGSTAVVDKRFTEYCSGVNEHAVGTVELTSYDPNKMTYRYSGDGNQLVVFSEIYYPMGWNAYVDGVETPHFRANYVLRSMMIPQGDHTIEFRFEPQSFTVGETVSYICSSLILIFFALALFFEQRKKKRIEA